MRAVFQVGSKQARSEQVAAAKLTLNHSSLLFIRQGDERWRLSRGWRLWRGLLLLRWRWRWRR